MNEPAAPLLSVRDLVVRYASARHGGAMTAVHGVSLELRAGRILALVGESGSGKTSLARAVLQLLPAAAGEVRLQGHSLGTMSRRELRAARRQVQAVFQNPAASLSPRRSVQQSLLEPLVHFGLGDATAREERARQALATVGLEASLLGRYPHELSGGQRQRVALARALVCEPQLIVADEPLSSVDAPARAQLIELLRDLRDRLGIAFLLVSHDLGAVRNLADTVAVMYCGRLVETGPAAVVLEQPAHPYTRALLAAVPLPDPTLPPPRALAGDPPSALAPPTGCVFHGRCPEAIERCRRETPAERAVGAGSTAQATVESGQRVQCHLWNP
jgi:oligopeptide/dipeptide ABC transporter ATP-binding protein